LDNPPAPLSTRPSQYWWVKWMGLYVGLAAGWLLLQRYRWNRKNKDTPS
jgi:hypothetical protein